SQLRRSRVWYVHHAGLHSFPPQSPFSLPIGASRTGASQSSGGPGACAAPRQRRHRHSSGQAAPTPSRSRRPGTTEVVRRLQSCDDTEMRWPAILYLACLAACSEDPDGVHLDGVVADESGRACASGVATGGETVVASPALDCPSRLCLHVQNVAPDDCTATCATAGDC